MQHKGSVADTFTTPGNNRATFWGYSVSAGGAACVVAFREDTVSGEILAEVKVAANDSKNVVFPYGIDVDGPIYVQYVSGTPSNVSLYWA